ncbi:MAG: hypothetical protein J6Z03_05660 [Erysipelotrichaceae bacterium]|nr:hypothetical protein [Erysipelotrichaceae bacterium]
MGRPLGGKNRKWTPQQKEAIVLEYLNGKVGYRYVASGSWRKTTSVS